MPHFFHFGLRRPIAFMRWHRQILWLSLFTTFFCAGLPWYYGIPWGVDFTGGRVIEVTFSRPVTDLAPIRHLLAPLSSDAEVQVQQLDHPSQLLIRMSADKQEERVVQDAEGSSPSMALSTLDRLQALLREFDPLMDIRRSESVGPQLGKELVWRGLWAICGGLLGVMLYLWFRFEWYYGVGALVALLHDTVVTFGLLCFLGLEMNMNAIAGLLTVIGYSVNDSVVIYDRVRENRRLHPEEGWQATINRSLNETLSRTTLTVLTTLLAGLSLLILGGDVIRSFSATVCIGITIGTFSSIFISAPLLAYCAPPMHSKALPAEESKRRGKR
jgi:preprotein translocase SecF subunit